MAESGEMIAKLLVEPIFENIGMGLLLWVKGKLAIGCCAQGVSASLAQLQQLVFSLEIPSLFQWCYKKKTALRAPANKDPLQIQIAEHLQRPIPTEVGIAPVLLHQRVVNLICFHSEPGRNFPEAALQDLEALAARGSAAYERIAKQIKHR
jgi:hypothetical protein